jgi:bacteriorhodopsin
MSQIVFIQSIGAAVFALASVLFALVGKKDFRSSVLVAGVTALSYFVMIQGSVVGHISGGELVLSRWVGYALSCSLLMVVISKGIENSRIRQTVISITPLVMLSGAVGAVMSGMSMWAVFLLGCIWYVYQLYLLYAHTNREYMRPFNKYIWFGWNGFPIVFLLSPIMLGVLSSFAAAVVYLLLDVFTKIVFYIELNMNKSKYE